MSEAGVGYGGDGVSAVECRGLSYRYPGASDEALSGVDLTVPAGTRLGVLGPNGGGKSTLIKLVLGLQQPSGGSVRVFGETPERARRLGMVGYVAQRAELGQDFPVSVRRAVTMPVLARRSPWRRLAADERSWIEQLLELVGVGGLASRPVGALSGGQLQRVLVARAVASRPRLLLMDEPTVGVDVGGQQRFAELLHRVQDALGLTIVVVTHELRTVAAGCDRVACLSRTLHSHTDPRGLTPGLLAEVFRHDLEGVFGDVHVDAHHAEDCDDPSHASRSNRDHGHGGGCG